MSDPRGTATFVGGWDDALRTLGHGELHHFADWRNDAVPSAPGVYTVWRGDEFIYVGMAGRGLSDPPEPDVPARRRGLRDRLNSHASGRRSGDQFCIYVFDRLVLPTLTPDDIAAAAAGRLFLDRVVREYIRRELAYRFVAVPDGTRALALERHVQGHGLSGRRPFLNPGPTPTSSQVG